jgi:hypothetical protein
MPSDRETARVRIARDGLTTVAVERVARTSFGRLPITLVDRARGQLRRFFSAGPWTVEDDAALAALVGPGEGWTEEELAPGVRVGFGWRGGNFRVEVESDETPDATPAPDIASQAGPPIPEHARTLGDTFEDAVVIELGRDPAELRFATGPGSASGTGTYTREQQGNSAAVAALFREFPQIEKVALTSGVVSVAVADFSQWGAILLQLFDTIASAFAPPRATPPDRQYERALKELGGLDASNPRDVARILDATTSPDAAFRRLAVAMLERADELVVQKPWTRSLDDSSRGVKRAAIRAMAHVARPDLRLLFERALADKDACVRYYGLRGLSQIGVGRALDSVERRKKDDDVRVRIAAHAALSGQVPQ